MSAPIIGDGLLRQRIRELEHIRESLEAEVAQYVDANRRMATDNEAMAAEIERLQEQVRNRDYALDRLGELKDAEIERLKAENRALREEIDSLAYLEPMPEPK